MRFRSLAIALSMIGCSAGTAHAQGFTLKAPPKIAMVYYGAKNDGGWAQSFDEARGRMESALGQKINYVDSVPENSSVVEPIVEQLIKRGNNIIIGTAFGFSDAFRELAKRHPDVAFLNAAGTTNGPNLESFYGRTYESQYLCGMAAAAASKTGKLGFVAANPIGLVNWTINAYELGAQKINPSAKLTVIFIGSWDDPVKERAAATALANQGVDVIGQHVDSPTVQLVAQERGIYGTGHHRDMRQYAPKATICSSVWVWDKFLVPEIRKIQAGNWQPPANGALVEMKDGGTDIVGFGNAVPADKRAIITAERDAIIKGKQIYAGPLSSRDGVQRVAAGQVLSDPDLWKMDWFTKDVVTQK
ncbi:BMP family ABC transporter substrate-binding protein [Paraburkholderia antibiotica]|uniref:BMP family ABC transporter substrate-binding protein n=1 Tax=Paraburkholderia antibiotica TaxID=2728839 RepID=A0A7X9ZXQ0_9BURK|nr:BMP family ABC transporter substrate-binding protein [Paraburkholderia antibiotica]NML32349.1 BMP family ABC transporter substrate-binding protein [Paraburkholderia antibiotica]